MYVYTLMAQPKIDGSFYDAADRSFLKLAEEEYSGLPSDVCLIAAK